MTSTRAIIDVLEEIIGFLNPMLPFANSHMVEFFTSNLWKHYIPKNVQDDVSQTSEFDVFDTLFSLESNQGVLGQYLLNIKKHTLKQYNGVVMDLHACKDVINLESPPDLIFQGFMSKKKTHEVQVFSALILSLVKKNQIDCVVDLGSGKGYLSSFLAMHSKVKVLGIDCQHTNTLGACRRSEKILRFSSEKEHYLSSYKQSTAFISEDTNLQRILEREFSGNLENLSLVGLHTCGDLASDSLKIFARNPFIKTLCNVGCCYHLITEKFDAGFPMSQHLKNKNFTLGRNARMLACQSVDRITFNKERPSNILFYRALLQILVVKHLGKFPDANVGKSASKCNNFKDYTHVALKKLRLNLEIAHNEEMELMEEYSSMEKTLQFFYLIRARLAPVIESVILLDRLLYLRENGLEKSFIIELFNPVVSPRCYGIVAIKN